MRSPSCSSRPARAADDRATVLRVLAFVVAWRLAARSRATRPEVPPGERALAGQLEVGQAGQHRLAADGRILERDADLLVVARQLRRDHDPVPPPRVADAVPVAVASLAGHDRALGHGARLPRSAAAR